MQSDRVWSWRSDTGVVVVDGKRRAVGLTGRCVCVSCYVKVTMNGEKRIGSILYVIDNLCVFLASVGLA